MNIEQIKKELTSFINTSIAARLENNLPVIKDRLIDKADLYLVKLNEEYKTNYTIDIESIVNNELLNSTLEINEIVNKVYSITNVKYNWSELETYLIEVSENIGYNDVNIYLSNGWDDIKINFKYELTSDYNIIIYSIK